MSSQRDHRKIAPETLERLRQTTIETFSQRGFVDANIKTIAKKAGVSPKTIYKYFGNKEEMLFACIEPEIQELQLLCSEASAQHLNIIDQSVAYVDAYFDYYFSHEVIARIVILHIHQSEWMKNEHIRLSEVHTAIAWIYKNAQIHNLVWTEVRAHTLINSLMGVGIRFLTLWLLNPDLDKDEIKRSAAAIQRKLMSPSVKS